MLRRRQIDAGNNAGSGWIARTASEASNASRAITYPGPCAYCFELAGTFLLPYSFFLIGNGCVQSRSTVGRAVIAVTLVKREGKQSSGWDELGRDFNGTRALVWSLTACASASVYFSSAEAVVVLRDRRVLIAGTRDCTSAKII